MIALLLLVGLLLLVSIWAIAGNLLFFLVRKRMERSICAGRGAKLRWMVLSGLLSSIASVFFIFICYPLGAFRAPLGAEADRAAGPVIILTHGLYHNASAWLLFRSHLRKAGFKNIFVMNYWSFFTSFETNPKATGRIYLQCQAGGPGPAGISDRPQSRGTSIQVLFGTIPGRSDTRSRYNFGNPAPGVQSRGFWPGKAGFKFALPWTCFHRT